MFNVYHVRPVVINDPETDTTQLLIQYDLVENKRVSKVSRLWLSTERGSSTFDIQPCRTVHFPFQVSAESVTIKFGPNSEPRYLPEHLFSIVNQMEDYNHGMGRKPLFDFPVKSKTVLSETEAQKWRATINESIVSEKFRKVQN